MTKEESTVIAQLAYGQHPNIQLGRELFESYYLGLQNISYRDAARALQLCLEEPGRTFAPTTGEIIAKIRSARRKDRTTIRALPAPELSREEREANWAKLHEQFPQFFTKRISNPNE